MRISDWSSDVCSSDLMAGLFWQVADSDSRLRAEAIEAARDIAGEGRYKYCVTRPEPVPQFGLATAAAGFRFALNAAAPVLASQLNGNWIGLFEVETTSGDLDRKSTRLNSSH